MFAACVFYVLRVCGGCEFSVFVIFACLTCICFVDVVSCFVFFVLRVFVSF